MGCSVGESCCNNICVNVSNCLGQTCMYSTDCGMGETCCNGKCIGQPCWTDVDCRSTYCCGGTCGYNDNTQHNADNTVWVVLGLIFGSVLIAIAISIFVRCICRRRRRGVRSADGSDIVGKRVIPATSAPYPCQSPPSYQQGYPNHPPPQYEQYLAYNEGTTIIYRFRPA